MIECQVCGIGFESQYLCGTCKNCLTDCVCHPDLFDADELGLDPESDNNPDAGERSA